MRYNPKTGSRTLDLMRWGLVPYWAKDLKVGFSTINAMSETIDTKPVFREAFRRRRCLVPGRGLQPHAGHPATHRVADLARRGEGRRRR